MKVKNSNDKSCEGKKKERGVKISLRFFRRVRQGTILAVAGLLLACGGNKKGQVVSADFDKKSGAGESFDKNAVHLSAEQLNQIRGVDPNATKFFKEEGSVTAKEVEKVIGKLQTSNGETEKQSQDKAQLNKNTISRTEEITDKKELKELGAVRARHLASEELHKQKDVALRLIDRWKNGERGVRETVEFELFEGQVCTAEMGTHIEERAKGEFIIRGDLQGKNGIVRMSIVGDKFGMFPEVKGQSYVYSHLPQWGDVLVKGNLYVLTENSPLY